MSGETETNPSGWSPDLLKQHYDARLIDLALRLDQRFNAQQGAIEAALTSAEKAVTKAEGANERRFEGVNEFRQQLNDQAATFARVDYLEQALGARDALIKANTERIRELELARSGTAGGQARVTDQRAFIATVVGVVGLLIIVAVAVANAWSARGGG